MKLVNVEDLKVLKKASLIGITLMGEIESDWEKENEQNKESTSQAD